LGVNGKISELQSAMGLSVLPYMEVILTERKKVVDFYNEHLDFSKLKALKVRANTEWNYSYYPVVFESEEILIELQKRLNEGGIFPRRYFYPSLNTIEYTKGVSMPISENISKSILCLPLFVGIATEDLQRICTIINN